MKKAKKDCDICYPPLSIFEKLALIGLALALVAAAFLHWRHW